MFDIRSQIETVSTNDDAVPLLGMPEHFGAVLLADYQRAGRGRRARRWIAPAGSSLLFTTILPLAIATDALWSVPFWTALCVAEGIETATTLRVGLQWPNDILLDGGKCCGILCVSRVTGPRAFVACGTGVNVVRPEHDATLAAVVPAPAFLSDRCAPVQRRPVLDAILAAYERRLDELADARAIARTWERRAELAGTRYRLILDGTDTPFDAVARRLDDEGSLVVIHRGAERRISLADARVLRNEEPR